MLALKDWQIHVSTILTLLEDDGVHQWKERNNSRVIPDIYQLIIQ